MGIAIPSARRTRGLSGKDQDAMGGRQRRRRAPFAALALALAACATHRHALPAPEREPAATPTLWSAQPPLAPHPLLYLLGSVHVGDPRMRELGGAVESAWKSADELVVEADVTKVDLTEVQLMMQRFGGIAAPERLQDRLQPETWQLLQEYLAQHNRCRR